MKYERQISGDAYQVNLKWDDHSACISAGHFGEVRIEEGPLFHAVLKNVHTKEIREVCSRDVWEHTKVKWLGNTVCLRFWDQPGIEEIMFVVKGVYDKLGISWTVGVINDNRDWSVMAATYPVPQMSAESFDFFVPLYSGIVVKDAGKRGYKRTVPYPGAITTMQYFAVYGETGGIYPLVNVRALTDDVELASRMLPQVIRGMQDNGLAACAKHFPGDGVDYRDQHLVTTANSLPMVQWRKLHGKVFADCIASGVMSIMPGHITLPAYQKRRWANGLPLPATLSSELIEELLKKEMGFEGIVVTDALNMGGFLGWYENRRRSQIESFKAGCDMMLWPTEHYVDDLVEAVENGYVSMERLDDAVSRILTVKDKLGLFHKGNTFKKLSGQEQMYINSVQQKPLFVESIKKE